MIHNWNEYLRQINDDNIDCWMLLITTCDPFVHEYISPFDLVSSVLNNIWWPDIDWCDMVDSIPWAVAWSFLRIDNTWNCVEFIDPATVFSSYNTDKMVSVSWSDPAWYLINKVMSSDGSILLSNVWWVLNMVSNSVSSFLWLSDTPSSFSWHNWKLLQVSGSNIVFVENDRSQWCNRYLTDDQNITTAPNTDTRVALQASYAEWNPSMITSDAWAPSITIQKTGMYHIWMNWGFYVNAWVNAAKIAVVSTISWDKKLLLNAKSWIYPSWHPIVLTWLWETHRFFAFSESSLVRLNAGTKLFFMVRISSSTGNMVTPEVVIEWKSLVGWHPWSWATEVYANKYCWSLFWVSWYSDVMHNAV